MEIGVLFRTELPGMDRRVLRTLTRAVVRTALTLCDGSADAEVGVLYVDDEEMSGLNVRYRRKAGPTDVLSFAMREGEGLKGNDSMLGDIAVSVETAQRQALAGGISLRRELATLLVHGSLHLLGWDHNTGAKRNEMQRLQRRCMKDLETHLIV
jgi:probable rRNA maturation factor